MISFLHIAGSLALLIYGVRLLRKGLDRLFGSQLAPWLSRISHNRWRGAAFGALISAATPSSTSIALIGVQMVKSGTIGFQNLWSVMLGATVGLTIMIQLIAFQVHEHATILILAGVILFQFGRSDKPRGLGQGLLGLGLILIGIWRIQESAAAVQGNEDLKQLIGLLKNYPWGLAALAAVLSVSLQSSTAALGLILGLTQGNLLTTREALPCVVGVNVGVGITMFLLGYSNSDSRRLGLSMLISKATIAMLLIVLMTRINPMLAWLSDDLGRQIANAHTGFAVLLVIIWLPFIPVVAPIIEWLVPDRPAAADPTKPVFLRDAYLDSPALAFGQSLQEISRMAGIVQSMFDDFWKALSNKDLSICDEIEARDDVVDGLNQAIKTYLTRLGGEDFGKDEATTQVAHLSYADRLENIGDIIDKNLIELVRKRVRTGGYFSDEGYADVRRAVGMTSENFVIATTAFATQDADLAEQLLKRKHDFKALDEELRSRHFSRLRRGMTESLETSAIHLDLLTYLKSINSHLSATAYPILDRAGRPHPRRPMQEPKHAPIPQTPLATDGTDDESEHQAQ
ncbi:MAG: Na/Pi cotransporter family protein [Planctomycetes bacterium]|nr:Na/Pi cotransporter family protein [Planctomycetota bacterium]NOG53433.1 Na/Pi cotransporter family protein [Planctomycetota bacterium]